VWGRVDLQPFLAAGAAAVGGVGVFDDDALEVELPRGLQGGIQFDVLRAADADVAARPLRERRGILEEIAADAVPAIVLPPVAADVDAALQTARELDLEGIVRRSRNGRAATSASAARSTSNRM
jgi:hypothetical protein